VKVRLLLLICFVSIAVPAVAVETGCLAGSVLDTAGEPIPNVHVIGVSPDRRGSFDVPTGAEGEFRIDTVPPGEYDVTLDDEYKADFRNIKFTAPTPAHAARGVALAGDSCGWVTLRAPPRARLHLKVTDVLTTEVLPSIGASFRFDSHSAWNGWVSEGPELAVPPFASLEVHVGALGYEDSEPISVGPLQPGEARKLAVALRSVQTGCIAGTVVDLQGLPVKGVTVQADLVDRAVDSAGRQVPRVLTTGDGHFSFPKVHPAEYLIYVSGVNIGYAFDQEDGTLTRLSVLPGQACAEVTVNMGPKAAMLQLQVVDAVTREQLQYSAWASGKHPQNGGWSLDLVENPMPVPALRGFEVSVKSKGYASQTLTIAPLQPEESRQLTIELQPDGSGTIRTDR
jgi:hypothetical protein